jgi:gluconolactonase
MGAVWIFDRKGQPLFRVNSCGSDLITNIAFGGPDNKTLFMTDSGAGIIQKARIPIAGRLMYSHL